MDKRFIYPIGIISCLLSSNFSNAKSTVGRKDSGVYISINGMYSFPVGYFKSPNAAGAGSYAMNGYGSFIEVERPIKSSCVGLAFEGGYSVNPFNMSAYENMLIPFYQKNAFYYYNFNNATPYKQVPVLIGMLVEKRVKKFYLQFQGLVGADFITLARVNDSVDAYNPNMAYPADVRVVKAPPSLIPLSQSTVCAVYNLKFSARYTLTKCISIQASVGYFNNFFATSKPSGSGRNNGTWPVDTWLPLSQIALELGAAVHL